MLFFPAGKIKKLEDTETKFQAAINSIQAGFIITDRQGEIETINISAKSILCSNHQNNTLSQTDPEIINLKCNMDLIAQNLADSLDIKKHIQQVLQNKKSFRISGLSYKNIFLNIAISPVFFINKKGGISLELIGAVILIEDVTEQKILERSKEDFFSIATHELKTPLIIIKGNSELIKKHFQKGNTKLTQIIDDIHSSSEKMIEIVNDFLDISRMEQGKIDFKKGVLDIESITKTTAKDFSELTKSKNLFIKFNTTINNLKAWGDEAKVKQILMNLIDNAIKFTDHGGITIDLRKDREWIKITITDTGCGISVANQKLIFRKFQLASDDILSRSSAKSTGVGLYIAKFMVEKMGGQIKLVYSKPGQGSSFEFTLPAT